jgi:hypothetical protein
MGAWVATAAGAASWLGADAAWIGASTWAQAWIPPEIPKTRTDAREISRRIAAGFVLKIISLPKNAENLALRRASTASNHLLQEGCRTLLKLLHVESLPFQTL